MPGRSRKQRATPHEIATEIVRRAAADGGGCVVRLSRPATLHEQLQLLAARLERRPIVIMPQPCRTADEWLQRYAALAQG